MIKILTTQAISSCNLSRSFCADFHSSNLLSKQASKQAFIINKCLLLSGQIESAFQVIQTFQTDPSFSDSKHRRIVPEKIKLFNITAARDLYGFFRLFFSENDAICSGEIVCNSKFQLT